MRIHPLFNLSTSLLLFGVAMAHVRQPQNLPPRPERPKTTTTKTTQLRRPKADGSVASHAQPHPQRGLLQVPAPNTNRVFGEKELLVIRLESPDGSTTSSEAQLINDVFEDELNVVKQYELCSHGKFRFVPAQGTNIRKGIATVTMGQAVRGRNSEEIYRELRDLAPSLFGRPLEDYPEVMVCMPAGTTVTMGDGTEASQWIAYVPGEHPYVNFLSLYNDGWCSSVSTGMHEIGHTLGLQHANEKGEEYEDMSGVMGYSTRSETGPSKCFNPPNSWHLGWYAENSLRINPLLDAPFRTELISVVDSELDEAKVDPSRNVILQIPNGQKNIYLGYNLADGFNSGTNEGKNKILVVEQNAGGEQHTVLLDKLRKGSASKFPNFGQTGKTLHIRYADQSEDGRVVTVEVYFDEDDDRQDARFRLGSSPESGGCPRHQARFEVTLVTDAYGIDSSWELVREATGAVVASRAAGSFADFETHDDLVCLDREETFVFTLRDEYGDGICCNKGWGSYNLFLDGREIVRGGEFGSDAGEGQVFAVTHAFATEPAPPEDDAGDDDGNENDNENDNNNDNSFDGLCRDDPDFRYRNVKKCEWLGKDQEKRCGFIEDGKPVKESCPVTCGLCTDRNNDNGGGNNNAGGDSGGECRDDPAFNNGGKRNNQTCAWAAKKQTNRRCKKTGIATHCPVTCGTCDTQRRRR